METLLSNNPTIQGIIGSLMDGETWLSYSSLAAFKNSPTSFIDYKLGKKEETDAMVYGSMVHCLVLEPDDFEKRYLCLDDEEICSQIGGAKPRATTKYKEWYQYTVAEAGKRIIVKTDDFTNAKIVSRNILFNRASSTIISMAPDHEVKIEWDFKNFKFRGFIDGIGEIILDLKTCADANPLKFQRDIINNSYYLQAAMYLYGVKEIKPYYIIAVDKKGGVSVHELNKKLLAHGFEEYETLLDKFNQCILKDHFDQSYDFWANRWDGIYDVEVPYKYIQ